MCRRQLSRINTFLIDYPWQHQYAFHYDYIELDVNAIYQMPHEHGLTELRCNDND